MNKNTLVLVLLASISIPSFSQIEKGDFAIGLQSGITSSNTKNSYDRTPYTQSRLSSKQTSFTFIPTFQYFVSTKLSLGIGIGYSGSVGANEILLINMPPLSTSLKSISHNWQITPFVTYYFPVAEKAYLTLKGSVHYSQGTEKNEYVYYNNDFNNQNDPALFEKRMGSPRNTSFGSIGISPGFTFFPAPKWALEFFVGRIVGYTTNKYDNNYQNSIVYNNTIPYQGNTVKQNEWEFLSFRSQGVNLSLTYFIR